MHQGMRRNFCVTPCLARADTNDECGWCWNKAELKHETFSQVEVEVAGGGYICLLRV